jgi:hypothetical protein
VPLITIPSLNPKCILPLFLHSITPILMHRVVKTSHNRPLGAGSVARIARGGSEKKKNVKLAEIAGVRSRVGTYYRGPNHKTQTHTYAHTHGDVLHIKRRRRYPPACSSDSCCPAECGLDSLGCCLYVVNVKIVSVTGGETNDAGEPVMGNCRRTFG